MFVCGISYEGSECFACHFNNLLHRAQVDHFERLLITVGFFQKGKDDAESLMRVVSLPDQQRHVLVSSGIFRAFFRYPFVGEILSMF